MKIFVSAAEISSDIQAEKIVRSIQNLLQTQGKTVQIAGIGGPRLRSIPGFHAIEKAEELRVMGFVEVLSKLSFIKKTMNRALAFISTQNPDLILTFDYPDFHLKLMKEVKRQGLALPSLKICAIPPKVWVWRSYRVEKIRKCYDGVLVVFPFEKEFYQSKNIPVIFEGNPLIAELFSDASGKSAPVEALLRQLNPNELAMTVMPGSRAAELKYHLPIIPGALELFSKKVGKRICALVPIPAGVEDGLIRSKLKNSDLVRYEFQPDGAIACLRNSNLGLIKSGTSTLEAALLGCVPVIFYKTSKITEWMMRYLVRYSGPVGLPNILLRVKKRSDAIYGEFLGYEATEEALAEELAKSFSDSALLQIKRDSGVMLKNALVPQQNVTEQIAKKILTWVDEKNSFGEAKPSSIFISAVSFLWSCLNGFRRKIYRLGLMHAYRVPVPSVLFGNLQAGGTGKTPLLIEFAQYAIAKGKRVAVVTRGYHGKNKDACTIVGSNESSINAEKYGDEAAEIKQMLSSVTLGIGPDRVGSVKTLLNAEPKPDLILFDDGYQNLKFRANCTVLCLTDLTPSQIPYRDFLNELAHADIVLRSKSALDSDLEWVSDDLPTMPVSLLCAVGDPEEVIRYYSKLGVLIKRKNIMKDHSEFKLARVKELMNEAFQAGLMLVVTPKDYSKLQLLGIKLYSDKLSTIRVLDPLRVGVLKRNLKSPKVLDRIYREAFEHLPET